jgi:hypothetical protein
MEVTVVKLRRHGIKIAKEALDAEPHVHGFLAIKYWHLKNGREDRKVKELILQSAEGAHCSPILTLTDADQTQLKGVDMVYVGTERVGDQVYPQAWWVKCDPSPVSNGVVPYANAGTTTPDRNATIGRSRATWST